MLNAAAGTSDLSLTGSAKSVFRKLVQEGPATRPQIGTALGLSRPTMSAAIGELERLGLAEMIGAIQGPLGRSAAQYRVGQGAGHVIGIDAGSSHVRLRVSTLDRRLLHSEVRRLDQPQVSVSETISRAVADLFAAAHGARRQDWGPLRTLGIAVPTRVSSEPGEAATPLQNVVFTAFEPPAGIDVVLENNVNCAAVAEQHYGAAQGQGSFAYVQIGLKIGMGLVLNGGLIRGRHGAVGEIGHLAFPFAPGMRPQAGEVERYLGAEGLMGRVRADWSSDRPAPEDTAALLALAQEGDAAARRHVENHAEDIGSLVVSCVSVIDPGLVVLGGGLGGSPMLRPGVQEAVDRLSYSAEIRSSTLGTDATVLGIERLAIGHALDRLVGDAA